MNKNALNLFETSNSLGIINSDDIENLLYGFYCEKISEIFKCAPHAKNYENEAIPRFKYGLYEYLTELFQLFKEIVSTEVDFDIYETTPDMLGDAEKRECYLQTTKFIRAIKLKKLRQGGCIDRYVKDMPFIPPVIMRLIKKVKGHYLLKNSDCDSPDYKLALLSCIRFDSYDGARLFELKMMKWEELNNCGNT